MAEQLWQHGVYAVAFSFPVVPQGQARIRVQLSAAHTDDDVDTAVAAFVAARDAIGLTGRAGQASVAGSSSVSSDLGGPTQPSVRASP